MNFNVLVKKQLILIYSISFCFFKSHQETRAQSCLTLCNPMDCSPPGFSVHGDSSGRNTGVGCHTLLQGIFQPRNQTPVSCIAGRSLMSEQSKQESFNLKNPLAKLFLTSVVQSLKHYFKWLFWVKITDYFSFFALYISPLF